jgi:Bacterial Ig-like domain/LVIVD repeat
MTAASLVCWRTCVVTTLLASAFCLPTIAQGATLGNLTYTQAELEKPVSKFGGTGADKFPTGSPTGSNTVVMLHGYMVVMGSFDSGKPPGALHTYDITNPRKPVRVFSLQDTPETSKLREQHAMPIAMIDGKLFLAAPTTAGVQFFDYTDPLSPKPSGSLALTGVNGGDYDNAAWMLSWAWPYLYVGGTGNGVFIVDATDPAKPSLVKQITSLDVGGFRVGPVYAAGNYLVVAQMDVTTGTHVTVMDVGNPKAPFPLSTGTTPDSLYSAIVIGDRLYGPGAGGAYSFMKWSPDAVSVVKNLKSGTDRGGYCGYTDGFLICGQSAEGYKKWDVRDEANITQVGHGTDPGTDGGDFDFATTLGNLVYLGNDHGSGAALIPHTMAPDSTPPKVVKIYPSEGDLKQPVTTRFTAYFSDDIDLDTVNAKNIIVRKNGDCTPLDGVFSKSSFNAISFGTKQLLVANATYDVIVPAGGLKDLAGNVITAGTVVHFSTGPTVDAVMACPGDGEVLPPGNEGGTGAGGGAMTAGAAGMAGSTTAAGGMVATGGTGTGTGTSGSTMVGTGGNAGTGVVTGGSSAGSTPMGAAGSGDSGGCGCSVPGRSRSPLSAASLLVMGAAWLATRRPRARRRGQSSSGRA